MGKSLVGTKIGRRVITRHFQTWNDFIGMGGYAFYVWFAYGVVLLMLFLLAVQGILRYRSQQRQLRQIYLLYHHQRAHPP